MPRYTFFPWARPDLKKLPAENLTGSLPANARAQVELTLNQNAPIKGDLLLDGPGDVIGIDPRQITRMDPMPGTPNFESNYFPSVEFARPDFPWLFTPASANSKDQLRPWVVLVVVRKQPGVALLRPERQLPQLEIKSPARPTDELPDLAQSWAWAHAQVEGVLAGTSLHDIFAQNPERAGSRLLCSRLLQQEAGYFACLVPAFEIGRLAGLGLPTESVTTLAPAWTQNTNSLVLPVYHFWEFATGRQGDFESLVKLLLEPKPGGAPVSLPRMVDPSDAGEGLPVAGANARGTGELDFALECPLVPLGSEHDWNAAFAKRVATALEIALAPSKRGDPRVTSPVYGGAFTPAQPPLDPAQAPRWLRELNLDPRFRLAASFGAEVIRRHQDRLVDSCWDQAGDIRGANTLIRNAQAATAIAAAIQRRHFSRLSDSALVEITRPLHGVLTVGAGGETFRAMLTNTKVPPVLAAAEFRRIARPRGPVFRRTETVAVRPARSFISGILADRLSLRFVRQPPPIATVDDVEGSFKANGNSREAGTPSVSYSQFQSAAVDSIPKRPGFAIFPPSLPQPPGSLLHGFAIFNPGASGESETAGRFRAALMNHLPRISAPQPQLIFAATLASFALQDTRKMLDAKIAPALQFFSVLQGMVKIADGTPANDPLATLRTSPTFPEPLYAALGAISPDLVVQGFERIEANTITPLQTNAQFVESFLVGANHEMSRELLWREFPVEARATFFQTFWDSRASGRPAQPDIPPQVNWSPSQPLGGNIQSNSRAVFLIRGELVRRYPTAIVYLVESGPPDAKGRPTLGSKEIYPSIRGMIGNDAAFYGFDVDPHAVVGQPGWIFVIQEPPSEPRFGIEVTDDRKKIAPAADAAASAAKYLQKPVRVAVHARDLMPTHA